MRQYKIVAGIFYILPIIIIASALPIAVQETRQLCGDVIPDVAITISAKQGDEMEKRWDMYSETRKLESSFAAHRPSGSARALSNDVPVNGHAPPQSPTSLAAPVHASMDPPQMGTSEIQRLLPGLTKSPSLNHFLAQSEPSVPTGPLSVKSDEPLVSSSPRKKFKFKSFMKKVFRKLKFWRRISGPGPVRDVANAANLKRESEGLVDTGITMVRDIGKFLNFPSTTATRGILRPTASRDLIKSHKIGVA